MRHLFLLFMWAGFATASFGQSYLVKDLITTPSAFHKSSSPTDFVEANGVLFFTATTPETGRELWRTDGSSSGTYLVRDIYPGEQDADIRDMLVVGTKLFFNASNGSNGNELWMTDGTSTGTVMVKDIAPGPGDSNPHDFCVMNGVLYFSAANRETATYPDYELWRSDGTVNGTSRLRDIWSGEKGSDPQKLFVFQNTLYFSAYTQTHGRELWKSNGTFAGTVLVKDIYPGPKSGYIFIDRSSPYADLGTSFLFSGTTFTHGTELWISDGTTAGTQLLRDINPGSASSSPYNLTKIGNTVYFSAEHVATGRELYKTDGTFAQTVLIEDIDPGANSGYPHSFTVVGSVLYFAAQTATHSTEIYRSLGTAANTYRITDFFGGDRPADPEIMGAIGNLVYFNVYRQSTGREVYVTNGNPNTVTKVREVGPGSTSGVYRGGGLSDNPYGFFQQRIFYSGNFDGTGELMRTDGTFWGTLRVKDINPQTSAPLFASEGASWNGVRYFNAKDETVGFELYRSDGTPAGTYGLKDIHPTESSNPHEFTPMGNSLYFVATDDVGGKEIWRTNGNALGTVRAFDLMPGSDDSHPKMLMEMNGNLYFFARWSCCGFGLIKYDGNLSLTMVKSLPGTSPGSGPTQQLVHNGILYFVLSTANQGSELWRSDGSAAGTYLLRDIEPGATGSFPSALTAVGNKVYFTASESTVGRELWVTDGTTIGTVFVGDIESGAGSSYPDELTEVNGSLYFAAYRSDVGHELFRYDPNPQSISLVRDIYLGASGSYPQNLTAYNNALYFSAGDYAHGRELWRTTGTIASTVMIKDAWAGSEGSNPSDLYVANSRLFFAATDDTHGREVWISDGSPGGTQLFDDVLPGPRSSSPAGLFEVNSRLVFIAYDTVVNREFHAINISGVTLPVTDLTLEGNHLGNRVALSWRTSREHNSDHFRVERSADGQLFEFVGTVAAAGDSDTGRQYHFDDLQPLPGKSYYRLVQFDRDGAFQFSNQVELSHLILGGGSWRVVPNPVTERTLKLTAVDRVVDSSPITIHVLDAHGRTLVRRSWGRGAARLHVALPESLAAGTYLVRIECEGNMTSRRFILH